MRCAGYLRYNKHFKMEDLPENKLASITRIGRNVVGYNTTYQQRYVKIKNTLFEILGNNCIVFVRLLIEGCCKFDHINGAGRADAKKRKSRTGMYQYYIANPHIAVKSLQILCANHNIIKRLE